MSQGARTLFEKVWQSHVVVAPEGEPALLYIDLHLLHEVTSPQAFEGLRLAGRTVRRPDRAIATVDHNVPTTANRLIIADAIAAKQMPCAPTAPSSAFRSTTCSRPNRGSCM
jgi:3-isopropylmalate/(R)-2-methylmalate dehydratase large subunit